MEKILSRRTIFTFISLLFFFIIWFCHSRIVYNEMDVVPFALAQYNPEYIANDWYLHLDIPYRSWFSYPVGFLAEHFGMISTVLIGRGVLYLLFATIITMLIRLLDVRGDSIPFLLGLIIFMAFFKDGSGAGEWMIGGLETKSFAYGFVLISLYNALKNNWAWALLWAGLAFSFHLLVGMYHAIALFIMLVYVVRRGEMSLQRWLMLTPLFLLSGYHGVMGVLSQLTTTMSAEVGEGWKAYVSLRVGHHTLPWRFRWDTWLKLCLLSGLQVYLFQKTKRALNKKLVIYGLSPLLFVLIGLVVYAILGTDPIMRLYFFRFNDIMLPFLTFMIGAAVFNEYADRRLLQKIRSFFPYAITIFLIVQLIIFGLDLRPSGEEWRVETSSDVVLQDWVRSNTDENAGIIVNPRLSYYYINYERPTLATWKHSPQSGKEVYEWYTRLKDLNKGAEIESRKQLIANYNSLTTTEMLGLAQKYPDMKYILLEHDHSTTLPVLATGDRFKLCLLSLDEEQ